MKCEIPNYAVLQDKWQLMSFHTTKIMTHVIWKSLRMLVMILGYHHSATEIHTLLKCCKVLVGSLYVGGFVLWPKKSVTTSALKFLHFANKTLCNKWSSKKWS